MTNDKTTNWSVRITLPESIATQAMADLLNYVSYLDVGDRWQAYTVNDIVSLAIHFISQDKDLLNLARTRIISKTDVGRLYGDVTPFISNLGLDSSIFFYSPSARTFKLDAEATEFLQNLLEEWRVNNKSDLLKILMASVLSSIDKVSLILIRAFTAGILLGTSLYYTQQKITNEDIKNYVICGKLPKESFVKYEIAAMKSLVKKYREINNYDQFRAFITKHTTLLEDRQKMITKIFSTLADVDPKTYSPYTLNDILLPGVLREFSLEYTINLFTIAAIKALDSMQPILKPPRLSAVLDYLALYHIRNNSSLDDGLANVFNSFIHPNLIIEMNRLIDKLEEL